MPNRMSAPHHTAVPLFQPEAWLGPLKAQAEARVVETIARGAFIFGPEVDAFEREFAEYLGTEHVVGVANGTDAITIALRALGVGHGDEVVVPSFTFYASVEAVIAAGAMPVFCDVDLETRNVTAQTVRAVLSSNTKAIVAVDLFGCPAPLDELREFGVAVLEDAAQAAGARLNGRRAGALADVATFSFYPSKNLPCFGDGGAIATSDGELAERVRTLRFHGSKDKETFTAIGYNSRLDELQGAVLRVLLPHLDHWSAGRRATADAYRDAGLGRHVGLPRPTRRGRGGLASLRGNPPHSGCADLKSERNRNRREKLLPHTGPPAARARAVHSRDTVAARDRGTGPHKPCLTDGSGTRARGGRRGRLGSRACVGRGCRPLKVTWARPR